jgi:hypothetical protein
MSAEAAWTLYSLLDQVRQRPAMYIGQPSLTRLHIFLEGYGFALFKHQIKIAVESPPFDGFHDWTARRFGWRESTAGWCNIILQETGNDESAALDRFFQLLDEFRSEAAPVGGD